MKTPHQVRVEEMMAKIGQKIPEKPTLPTEEVCQLRSSLIMEESFEIVEDGLGMEVQIMVAGCWQPIEFKSIRFVKVQEPDLVQIADGGGDVSVVTIGTLSACGIHDNEVLEAIDENNLQKFGPGGYKREDGKWIKPPDHRPPDIEKILKEQEQL